MRCPHGDGELIARSLTGSGGVPLTYHLCLGCMGHWLNAFDANYIPLEALPDDQIKPPKPKGAYVCPECHEPLESSRGEVIPPGVEAWNCTASHGYFFPRGNLRKFRLAQEARVSYHKLWKVPMPPLKTVLLASVVLFTVISSVVALRSMSQKQQTQTQAQQIVKYHTAIVDDSSVTIIGRTDSTQQLSIVVPSLGLDVYMTSSDGKTHTLTIPDVQPGSYTYRFLLEQNGKQVLSPEFTFEVR